jgi:replicative DNA helicase
VSAAPVTPIRPAARTMPHNLDFEASIIGSVLLHPEVLADLGDVDVDDFYHWPHKIVWTAIRSLAAAEKPVDVVMLDDELVKQGKSEAVGGMAFLGELAMRTPTHENVIAYRDEVRLLARNRKAILALSSALERAYTWAHEPSELVEEVAGELGRIELTAPRRERVKLISIPQALEELANSLSDAPVFDTPFETLNDAIGFGGFLGTQVYTVAAGTGRGKTSWISEVSQHTGMQQRPVLVVSYEMKPGYIVARKAAGLTGAYSNDIIRGRGDTGLILRSMPIAHVFFLHNPVLADIEIAADQLAQKFGTPPLIVVDYLQKLANQIARAQQRPDMRAATTEASERLVGIADRTRSAVLAVSAIGRGNNKKAANPRELAPYELVDVAKESGDVEYDGAGLIVLSLSNELDGDERIGTITLAKARFGRERHIDARYDGRRGSWRDCGPIEYEGKGSAAGKSSASNSVLRTAIIRTLRSAGPLKSKTKIHNLTGRNKPSVFSEIDAMMEDGSLVMLGGTIALPEHLPAQVVTAPQGELAALISEATS